MASIDRRERKDGSVSYRLRWRYSGRRNGAPQARTYEFLDDAKKMKGAIEARGHLIYADDPAVVDFSLVTGMRQHRYTAPTFGEIAERYIGGRIGANAKSREKYQRTVRTRLSSLVARPIESIEEDDIRWILTQITDAGGSARAAYEMTCSVFKYAANKGMLPRGNPCAFVEPPKQRGKVGVFLTQHEAAAILEACMADPDRSIGMAMRSFVRGILGTGMRISEAVGLVVDDLYLDNPLDAWIDVKMQLSKPSGGATPSRVPVKSEAGERRIALDEATAGLFARAVAGKRPSEPIFADPHRGGWWRQSRVNAAWARARAVAQANGLTKSPRIHDLRHTHAAWLITDNIPLLAVSRRLGHESISVTADTYGHLLPEADEAIRGALGRRCGALR